MFSPGTLVRGNPVRAKFAAENYTMPKFCSIPNISIWKFGMCNIVLRTFAQWCTICNFSFLAKSIVWALQKWSIFTWLACLGVLGGNIIETGEYKSPWTPRPLVIHVSSDGDLCEMLGYIMFSLHKAIQRGYFDRLMQERRNSSALAMELCLSCTNPPICSIHCIPPWPFAISNFVNQFIVIHFMIC